MADSPQSPYGAAMTLADLVHERVSRLPEPLAREVLDFAAFLEQRGEEAAWQDLARAQAEPLARVWNNDEDRVWDDL